MQFPPLPLANFSIHGPEQSFEVFVVAVLQNGRQIMAGPCFQAGNLQALLLVEIRNRDLAKSRLPRRLAISGALSLLWN